MNNVIECRNLMRAYRDANRTIEVLRSVDLAIAPGQSVAICGASGAGKTTLLHLIGTLDRPTAGAVLFRGLDLATLGRAAVNRIRNEDVGFVFQFYHLLPEFTALENVMMPALARGRRRSACRDRAQDLLTRVGLAQRTTHKPGQLSGGEQQRVAIARALFNRPAVVLADEPTGNLDEHTGEGIIDLLWTLNRAEGVTLVLVTHDEHVARQADRTFLLHDGIAREL